MDKWYVHSGNIRTVLLAEDAHEAAVKAFTRAYSERQDVFPGNITIVDPKGFCDEDVARDDSLLFSTELIIGEVNAINEALDKELDPEYE